MFRYYCRIWDKYQLRVKALAVLIDGDKSFHPGAYQESDAFDEDCRLYYSFKVYKVMDQSEEELKKSDNPFAIVILAAKALLKKKSGKLSEEDLFQLKLDLVDRVEQKELPETKRQALLGFLMYYLPFESQEMELKFQKSINKGGTATMGIIESLVTDAREVGKREGKETKERTFVQTLIRDTDFDDQKIAALAAVEEAFVKKVRMQIRA